MKRYSIYTKRVLYIYNLKANIYSTLFDATLHLRVPILLPSPRIQLWWHMPNDIGTLYGVGEYHIIINRVLYIHVNATLYVVSNTTVPF